jgi:hypothetical protein
MKAASLSCLFFACVGAAVANASPDAGQKTACQLVSAQRLAQVVHDAVVREPGPAGFQHSHGPAGHSLLISVCAWTYGTPDQDAAMSSSPVVQITYFVASSSAAARAEFSRLKTLSGSAWRPLTIRAATGVSSPSVPSGQTFAATGLALHGATFYRSLAWNRQGFR